MTCISPLQIPTGMPGSGSSSSSRPRLPKSSRSQLAKLPINSSSLPSTTAGTTDTSSQPGRSPTGITHPIPNPSGTSNTDPTDTRSLSSPSASSHMSNHREWQSSYFPPTGYVSTSSKTGNLPPPEILAGGGLASPNAAALSPPVSDTQLSLSAGNKPSFLDPSTAPTYCRNGVPSYVPAPQPLPRSISADAATTASSAQVIRRLSQQNNRIREAWEAERKYMEANRERVEEVYKEERVIMEEERVEWESEKSSMLEEIRRLKSQVSGLEQDKTRLQSEMQQQLSHTTTTNKANFSNPGSRANGGDGSTDVSVSSPSHSALFSANDLRAPISAANGTRGIELPATASAAMTKARTFSPPQLFSPGGTRLSPSKQPEASPFIPIDPTMQPVTSPPIDFLGSPKDEDAPIIDIQTIHPELDGIAVRAPAIQKETFTDSETENSKSSSRDQSPSGDRPDLLRRSSSKEQTLQVLAAPEPARLVMHAGHTPNHSLSQFPTAAATEPGTAAEQSSSPTPTSGEPAATTSQADKTGAKKDGKGKATVRIEDSPAFELEATDEDVAVLEPVPILEAPEDPELKGPLMVRNIPAHDEIFFRRLSEKLEDVSRGNDTVPVCLQSEQDEAGPSGAAKENLEVGSDGATDAMNSSGQRPKEDAADIPLKLKKTTNFGAPLGTMF